MVDSLIVEAVVIAAHGNIVDTTAGIDSRLPNRLQ